MKEELGKIIKGEILDSNEILEKYSHDASIFEIKPKLVIFPKGKSDIVAIVKFLSENRKKYPDESITVRSAGTCMSGGSINDSIILDVTKYMGRIVSINRTKEYKHELLFPNSRPVTISGEAIVEPGCYYRDFEKEAEKYNLLLPCYTASKSINAIGGMVGNNSGGELTLKYGKTEDYVKELKVILTDGYEYTIKPLSRRDLYGKIAQKDFEGELYKKINDIYENNKEEIISRKPKVSKNSAGYNIWNIWKKDSNGEDIFDPCQLIIGSQGTLGIVTEITLRLVEPENHKSMAVLFLNKLDNLGEVLNEILKQNPTTIESFDDKTFKLAMRYFGEFVKRNGLLESIKFSFSFWPEFLMLLGGVPKLMLLVEFWSDDALKARQMASGVIKSVKKYGINGRITRDETENEKYWKMRRESFALLRKHSGNLRTVPFIDDIIVPPQTLPEFLPKLDALIEPYKRKMIYTIAGHAGNGNFHIIPLMDFSDPKLPNIINDLSKSVYELTLKYGGSITAEHNDGIIRTPYLRMQFGEKMIKIFEEIKDAYDPKLIFNPHKKVGVEIGDIKNYMHAGGHNPTHGS